MHTRLALLSCSTVLAATEPAHAADWGTPGLDATHGRLSGERSGALFADGRWTLSIAGGSGTLASPVVADGYAVTADMGGVVRALQAETGEVAWQATVGSSVQGTPAMERGRVYVPTLGNSLVALRLADGAVLWTRDLGGMALSSPAPVNGDIVIAAGFPQRHIERLSGETGEVIWRSPPVMEQFSNTSPAVGGGVAVVGSNGGRYYAFDLVTGLMKWTYAADGIVHLAAPLIVGDRVYMAGGADSGRVHAVALATGTAVTGWPVELPAPEADIAGTRKGRQRAVSSFASLGGLVVLQTRLDDAMDTNADGAIDTYLSREWVVGLDGTTGSVVWQQAVARAERTDVNDVPKFFVCPTPAAYGTDSGATLLAVSSSLGASVFVLDAASGGELAQHAVVGPALASPVVANGRLLTLAMDGTLQSLASSVNHPPTAPVLAEVGRPLDIADATLRWLPATDPDGELASYELRIDADGELLESWQQQMFVGAGVTSTRLPDGLLPAVKYTYAVRARDARGALSPWSKPAGFELTVNPAVTVGGTTVGSLAGALGMAQPGDVIGLGAGIYTLTETLHVRGGVSIQGAGAGRTVLDATGLGTGVSFDGTDAGHGTGLDGATVTGADTCVAVGGGATDVRLSHVIVRDCRTSGVSVASSGGVEVVNATLVGNGTGVSASGKARIRNSLLSNNGVALAGNATDALASTYNDLFGNQKDYTGLGAGTGDLSTSVTFADLAGRNLRLGAPQASTDRGDPTDGVGDEPAPNGGRVNLGAFGGTAEAELSAPSTAIGGSGAGASPTADPRPAGQGPAVGTDEDPASAGGCNVGGSPSAGWLGPLVLLFLFLAGLLIARGRSQMHVGDRRARRRG